MFERVTTPMSAVGRAVRRPSTYRGHVRELTSTLVTSAMWPLGWSDRAPGSSEPSTDADPDDPTPVLLVHGFGANKSNWLFIRRHLHQAGFTRIDALNYNPFSDDVPGLAARCATRTEQLKEHYGVDRVHLVGHSMGGIIIRYAVQVDGLEGVGVVATVSSPHGGHGLARYHLPFLQGPFAAGLQLDPASTVMRLFRSTARPMTTRFVAYYSNLDLIVPARRAMIVEPELDATNILIKDHGHLSIMLSRRLATSIVDQLGAADGRAGFGAPVRQLSSRMGTDAAGLALPPAVND
jgi:pimeloyl-ACP methyl ester carboxylesterase